ncbi:alcohol dehydrogenase [Brucella melitensis]|nr:alcohol dehydrogenase [Brucella melitensis]
MHPLAVSSNRASGSSSARTASTGTPLVLHFLLSGTALFTLPK